ncbi:putative 4-amino-4-deoxy-L-arabinose-phosphoundecaprenol flippase subunit ArnF [subsurface metagenome]
MRVFDLLAVLVSVSLAVVGQLLLKIGMLRMGRFSLNISTIVPQYTRILLNPFIIAGIISFALSMLVWLYVLSRLELSVAYPFVALNYVLILFASHFLLKETITPVRIIGVAVIVIGVYLISRGT